MHGIILWAPSDAKVSAINTLVGKYAHSTRRAISRSSLDLSDRSDKHRGSAHANRSEGDAVKVIMGGPHGFPRPDTIDLLLVDVEVQASRAARISINDLKRWLSNH